MRLMLWGLYLVLQFVSKISYLVKVHLKLKFLWSNETNIFKNVLLFLFCRAADWAQKKMTQNARVTAVNTTLISFTLKLWIHLVRFTFFPFHWSFHVFRCHFKTYFYWTALEKQSLWPLMSSFSVSVSEL